jgi:hypothetical protein
MVEKAQDDDFFLGKALSEFQEASVLDAAGLAATLRCAPQALDRLALCRWPDDRDASFVQEVRAIASFAQCDGDALIQVLRQVAAMRALRDLSVSSPDGLLMAARDRHEGEPGKKAAEPRGRKRRFPK